MWKKMWPWYLIDSLPKQTLIHIKTLMRRCTSDISNISQTHKSSNSVLPIRLNFPQKPHCFRASQGSVPFCTWKMLKVLLFHILKKLTTHTQRISMTHFISSKMFIINSLTINCTNRGYSMLRCHGVISDYKNCKVHCIVLHTSHVMVYCMFSYSVLVCLRGTTCVTLAGIWIHTCPSNLAALQ